MITSIQTVCVVIPVYQSRLLPSEQAALDRCISVLHKHPIVIIGPESLCTDDLVGRHPELRHESFPDAFFDDVKSYNRLMLSDEFYSRFASYEYMLLYQLDAFVFSDQLLYWCSLGYDYIGAPWMPPVAAEELLEKITITLQRQLHRLYNRSSDLVDYTRRPQLTYSAGNGGFSLRRISAMRKTLRKLHKRAEHYRAATIELWQEDVFFSVEANRYRTRLRIPRARTAAHFSWETNPSVAARLTNGKLPFGCHAWNKLHRSYWNPIFAEFGYSLDELLGDDTAGQNPS